MLSSLITLAIGIAVGVAGNFAYQWIREAYARFAERIDLRGVWGERMLDGVERNFSIGEINYDIRRMMWVFDGTNYHDDGTAFCHWKTISSYIDRNSHRYYYIFHNTHVDNMQNGYTGFGFVDLARQGKTWMPRSGAFAAGNPGESFRSHTMVRLGELPLNERSMLESFKKIAGETASE
ncbi:Uncharacterised protein [Mycobacteroides abscessus subsp. abscessus]|uniref:hypothetical protein n=1 Tax=Mycobacteroides abscessus TaxID=36809 RepID=UPI0009272319|nr:hypothetical protein [Mycobacteroides abscessus]SHY17606.1 Uncharacterised protein [Mycobacteroides abscessus subsp. abscessus]